MFTVETLITLGVVYLVMKIIGMFLLVITGGKSKPIENEQIKRIASSLESMNKVLNKWEQVRRNDMIAQLNKMDEKRVD